ncbi:MAG: HlyD family type I secretion periplasmic adaptor subunit [Pseudomonadota bacterium]
MKAEAKAARHIWPARGPLLIGVCALVLLIGGLGGWSLRTTLAGAVIASGKVQVESNRQVIQHPDGGVVQEILVRNGDTVAAGDILLRLDGRRLQSELAIIEGQLRGLAARRTRLIAERNTADTLVFPPELVSAAQSNPDVRALLDGETSLFEARLEAATQQSALLDKQNEQIAARVSGIKAQLAALERQLEIVIGELANKRALFEDGLAPVSVVLDLERELAGVEGEVGRLRAEIAGLDGEITANEIERLQIWTARREAATSAERDLEFDEIELNERRIALIDRLSRMALRAPVAGIVYESQIYAEAAVVQPAQPVMYIVPQDQPLIVSARVDSIDIDEVFVGQAVSLRFSAFDQKGRKPTPGQVMRISADAILDEATRMSYYAVEIRPDRAAIDRLPEGEALVPGMPVETYIRTRDRTAFAYLAEPFTAFFDKTFRE